MFGGRRRESRLSFDPEQASGALPTREIRQLVKLLAGKSGSARDVFAAPRQAYTKALFDAAFNIEADVAGIVSQ